MMSSFVIVSALTVLFISSHYSLNHRKRGKRDCSLPHIQVKHGKLIRIKDPDNVHIIYKLECDKGYNASSGNSSIRCHQGRLPHNSLHCEDISDHHSAISYTKRLMFILPSVAVLVVIIIVVTLVIRKNKKSEDYVPKWTRNKEDREKKNSSEMQEKVYKDLIEASRISFRFPFFRPKGRSTGKKPALLEEDGYLVPYQRERNCDTTNLAKKEFQSNNANNPDLEVEEKGEKTAKCKNFGRKLITELEYKQAARINKKSESQNKNTTKPQKGMFAECEKKDVTATTPSYSRPNHTYANLEAREDVVLKQEECKRKHSQVSQKKTLRHQVDHSVSCSPSFSCKKPSTNQMNGCLGPNQRERVDIPTTYSKDDLQIENKCCISLTNQESQEEMCVTLSNSIKESQTTAAKLRTCEPINVQLTETIIHNDSVSTKTEKLKKKHLYCNLIVSNADQVERVEEISDESPTSSPLHVYANLQLR